MRRSIFCFLVILLTAALSACGESTQQTPASTCNLDAQNLDTIHGRWVSLSGGGSGRAQPDRFVRAKFFKESTKDGEKQRVHFIPGKQIDYDPRTHKYVYEFKEYDHHGDAIYEILLDPKSGRPLVDVPTMTKRRRELIKSDNEDRGRKFEGRLYVKVDQAQCSLVVSDMYVTYLRGEMTLDSNESGIRTYRRISNEEEEMSWVECDEFKRIFPFAEETVTVPENLDDGQAFEWRVNVIPGQALQSSPSFVEDQIKEKRKNRRESLESKYPDGVPETELQPLPPEQIRQGEPVWFHYIPDPPYTGDKAKAKLTEAGVFAEEGATYDFEIWIGDSPVDGRKKHVPNELADGRLEWKFQHTFTDYSGRVGKFVEMHRYKTKDNKRELIHNSCMSVWTRGPLTDDERKKAAEEAAAKEAEAQKGK